MAAYKSLEAEFTRRSQRLKELEEENKAREKSGCCAPSRESDEITATSEKIDESDQKRDYRGIFEDGRKRQKRAAYGRRVSSAAPGFAPRTLKEAGALAERFLKN